jgi:pantoate--beta-alanine ligase
MCKCCWHDRESDVPLELAETIDQTRAAVARARADAVTIGFVPTMGALHEGHASLMRRARAETGFVVVSIFVNPTQFGPNEDFARYPRPFERDVQLCVRERVDLIFHPEPATVYPPGFRSTVEVPALANALEGASRPGHFRGVATVVLKLLNIVRPDVVYFGQKDAQQFRLLEQVVRDFDVPATLKLCPTVREPDGLALSSRNVYLDADQRPAATVLSRALDEVRRRIEAGERRAGVLIEQVRAQIATAPGARIDYVAAVAYDTLQPIENLRGRVLIALAVYFGTTRLIDNALFDIE